MLVSATLIACKSALTVLLLGRRAFASQRVPVCLPATLVDSSSFCFATCVCQSACDSGRLGSTRSCVDRRSELVELASRWRVARKSVARRLQNRPPSASQSSLRRPKNRRPEGLKSTLGGSKIEPRSPRTLRGPPGAPQERPKSVPRRLKNVPRAPQSALRPPKSGPRAAQERPKSAQEGPKTPLKALRGALGDHFDARKLEKRAFRERSVARLAREARSEGFSVDFQEFSTRARKGRESSDMRSDS